MMQADIDRAKRIARINKECAQMEKAGPSELARQIVANRKKNAAIDEMRAELELAAKDMGIPAKKLAQEILIERELHKASRINTRKQFEAGFSEIESRERRSIVKAQLLTEKATRPDYHIGRELLERIGRDKGVVISSMPDNSISVYAVKKSIDPRIALALLTRAQIAKENAIARVDAAELAIKNSPLSHVAANIPPAMKRELNKALDALSVAERRFNKAYLRYQNSGGKSAEELRLEKVAEFTGETVFHFDVCNVGPANSAIDSWELPNQVIRRPFREYKRLRHYRKWPISQQETILVNREIAAENAIERKKARREVNGILAEKWQKEFDELVDAIAIVETQKNATKQRNNEKAKERMRRIREMRADNAEYKMHLAIQKRESRARNTK